MITDKVAVIWHKFKDEESIAGQITNRALQVLEWAFEELQGWKGHW